MSSEQIFPWGNTQRYNAFSAYQKRKYGERVQKVTVDAGFTCPNRDGTVATGGCIYCNNRSFNPGYNDPSKPIRQQIDEGIDFLKRRYSKVRKFIVYFQPYSNTYAERSTLKDYYEQALGHPEVVGLTIGTRPDCIDASKIDYLEELARHYDITIEYGLESVSDETLRKINRGHDFRAFEEAVNLTRNRGINIGTHIIFGFPWETRDQWIHTADILSRYPLTFVKIHQLHVVRETALARMYERHSFELPHFEIYIRTIVSFLERLRPDIVIQRMFGEAPPHLLIAPKWNIRNSELLQLLNNELVKRNTWQGRLYSEKVNLLND